jgi:hypothetical protein
MRVDDHQTTTPIPPSSTTDDSDPRRVRILAKTIYRELRSGGLDERGVLALATELLALVAEDIRSTS